MGRLAGFRYRDIIKKIKRFGFEFYRQAAGSHEIWFNPDTNKYTTIPNHPGDMPEGTLRAILKQANIDVNDFLKKKWFGFHSCSKRFNQPLKQKSLLELVGWQKQPNKCTWCRNDQINFSSGETTPRYIRLWRIVPRGRRHQPQSHRASGANRNQNMSGGETTQQIFLVEKRPLDTAACGVHSGTVTLRNIPVQFSTTEIKKKHPPSERSPSSPPQEGVSRGRRHQPQSHRIEGANHNRSGRRSKAKSKSPLQGI